MDTHHPRIDPIVVGMQVGMQVLFGGLLLFVVTLAVVRSTTSTPAVLLVAAVLAVAYVGVLAAHAAPAHVRGPVRSTALATLVVAVLALTWLDPYAAYLLLPLSFLFVEHLPPAGGAALVVATAVATVLVVGPSDRWTVGGVVGPLASAGVALVIGLSFGAMRRARSAQETLYRDLLAVQGRLAVSERNAGVLAERARLARDIHDTVAQSLSSITLLLHAVERADPTAPGVDEVRLARETAAATLADTRRLIAGLAPPLLDEDSLGGALRRLAGGEWSRQGLDVRVVVADALDLAMPVQTALLRIAQGAMANVLTHAQASTATVEVVCDTSTVTLVVCDDGVGIAAAAPRHDRGGSSFGLRAIRERAEQFGGTSSWESDERGTRLTVQLPRVAS